jgi:hypothetical protein
MALKIRKMSAIHVDEGVYTAVVASVQKAEGKFGDYISWSFLIKGAVSDGDPIEQAVKITGRTSATFNEKSKLYSWARACGLDVDTDEIDIEQALRKAVRVVVEDKEGNSGETISVIKKIMPLKKAKKEEEEDEEDTPPPKAKKVKKPEPEEEEDEEDTPPPKAKKANKEDDDLDDLLDFDDED